MGFCATSQPFQTVQTASQQSPPQPTVRLSDAYEIYVRLKGRGKSDLFYASTDRNMAYAKDCLGDADIMSLGRLDAAKFRDHLIDKGMTTISSSAFAMMSLRPNVAVKAVDTFLH